MKGHFYGALEYIKCLMEFNAQNKQSEIVRAVLFSFLK